MEASPPEESHPAEAAKAETLLQDSTVWFMAISVGIIVANTYYIQPLLADIAHTFHLSVTDAGGLAMLTQLGTALGMLLFVPLGDIVERRGLLGIMLLISTGSLLLVATAQNAIWMGLACLLVGLLNSAVHVIVPFAAHLAPEASRGRIVGKVLSGLLLGILLARTFSGTVGAVLGWRMVYFLAAGFTLLLNAMLRRFLPKSEPTLSLSYVGLFKSIVQLARKHGALRESALLGALFFAAFSAFWTTLVFFLGTPPYHFGSEVAGSFGLVGAAGALGAPLVGRFADHYSPRLALGLAIITVFISFIVLGAFGHSLVGLAIGILLMDLGVQSGHVSSQARIYSLDPAARGRLNTVYMVTYFLGGSLGSYLGAYGWHVAQWWGVCGFALLMMLLAGLIYGLGSRKANASAI